MKRIITCTILALLLAVLVAPGTVSAMVQLPHAFYGHVLLNGSPAPDGTLISATVNEGTILQNTQNPVPTKDGGFGLTSPYLLVQGDIPNGATITFHVANEDGTKAYGTYDFEAGGGPDGYDLEVSITKKPKPPDDGDGVGVGAPHYTDVETDFCGMTGSFRIYKDGKVMRTQTVSCADGPLCVTIEKGTTALDSEGDPLSVLTIIEETTPPPPPEGDNIISIPFNIGPAGATFNPELTFTWTYDPDELPEGVAPEDLVIAFWNGEEWVEYPCVVDTEKQTVTAYVDHFTIFALLSPAPEIEVPPPKPVPPKPEEPKPPTPEKPKPVEPKPPPPPAKPEVIPEIPPSLLGPWIAIGVGLVVAVLIVWYIVSRRRQRG